ncbi:MAG TPA: inositol monophosphatase family protein [Gaiellaceae bacterium]|nr:inositol monophosphatase family protein [Gaiellaceae bacterium]
MNWLERCRAAVADVKTVLAEMPDRDERERPIRKGKGGDMTAALDEAAETAALRHFDHDDVRIVSEEIGVKGSGRYQVLVDPIDGSQNAERGIPYFALSVAVADGDTIDDVFFGYVFDFGASEEWYAVRGEGAFLDGEPLTGEPKGEIEMLSLEATKATLVRESLDALAPLTDRVRVMGAQALSYCHLAAGRTDAVVCLKPSRPVDFAAAQLIVRERGFAFELFDAPPLGASPLDLTARSRVVAAGNTQLCRTIATALTG